MNLRKPLISILLLCFLLLSMTSCKTSERLEEYSVAHNTIAQFFSSFSMIPHKASLPSYYYTGESWTKRAVELIESAENYVLIDTFLVGSHVNSIKIFEALSNATKRGVTVKLLMDSASYYRKDRTTALEVPVPIQDIKAMGIDIIEYNPIRAFKIFRLLGLLDRDHRKFWIIDGKYLVAGGMNIDPDSLGFSYERGSIDGMTEIYSPQSAAQMINSFIRTWNLYALEPISSSSFPVPSVDEGLLETEVWLLDQNTETQGVTTRMFDSVFSQAEDSILMIQCYMILTPALLERIAFTIDRGVEVHVILSANHVSARFTYATYYSIKDLLEVGARVFIYESPEGSLLHKKLITADDSIVAVGSANYNYRSQTASREISMVFDDVIAYDRLSPFIADVRSHCREVSEEESLSYRGLAYYLNFMMMQLGG